MFVKRARCSGEQNVMVCQEGDDIVFVTKRAVAPQTELLYWYASDYAQMLGEISTAARGALTVSGGRGGWGEGGWGRFVMCSSM